MALEKILMDKVAVTQYGVDATGVCFVSLLASSSQSFLGGKLEALEAERRFMAAVRLVEMIHAQKFCCGDLCPGSFILDTSGDVLFSGVMGGEQWAGEEGFKDYTYDVFCAPERELTLAADVYSLGVLGYNLFCRKLPYGEDGNGSYEPLSQHLALPPVWAEEVFRKALSPEVSQRYPNARALLHAVRDVRERAYQAEQLPANPDEASPDGPELFGGEELANLKNEEEEERGLSPTTKKLFLVVPVFLVLAALFVIVYRKWQDQEDWSELIPEQEEAAVDSPEVVGAQLTFDVDKMVEDPDPLSGEKLIDELLNQNDPMLRKQLENALLARAERHGLIRTADVFKTWFQTVDNSVLSSHGREILRLMEASIPEEVRFGLLRRAYRSDPRFALRLAAALSFDLDKLEEFQPLLAQLVGDSLSIEDASSYSTTTLLFAHPDTSTLFGTDLKRNRNSIPNDEISFVLNILAERGDLAAPVLVDLALDRKILSPVEASFFQLIRERSDLPSNVAGALVRLGSGKVTEDELSVIGRWFDRAAEKILLGAATIAKDQDILPSLYDYIAGKSPSIEPSASMLRWVNRYAYDDRGSFVRLIGVLAYLNESSQERVNEALEGIEDYVEVTSILEELTSYDSSKLQVGMLTLYAPELGTNSLLNALRNPSVSVRKIACEKLPANTTENLVGYRIVSEVKADEKDASVKKCLEKFDLEDRV